MEKSNSTITPEIASLLSQLEEIAYKLGVDIRYEDLNCHEYIARGGLCRVKEKRYIIVNQKDSMVEQAKTIARALCRFDLETLYLRPGLRKFIDTESGN